MRLHVLILVSSIVPGFVRAQTTSPSPSAPFVVLSHDIKADQTLHRDQTYVVAGEVHVISGVTLTVEDGVTILIRNGEHVGRSLRRAALLFDPGSQLVAETIHFRAADAKNSIERRANNGGVWFLGSTRSASKDGITAPLQEASGQLSRFQAQVVTTSFLGSVDDEPSLDDLDGFSVLGVGRREWQIAEVQSDFSGDDGFDVTNSHVVLRKLSVSKPSEDGLNISSSRVLVTQELKVSMGNSRVPDREIFDFEVDDGPSFVSFERACRLDLSGYFGDEVTLASEELPEPQEYELYWFAGTLRRSGSVVFSLTED